MLFGLLCDTWTIVWYVIFCMVCGLLYGMWGFV